MEDAGCRRFLTRLIDGESHHLFRADVSQQNTYENKPILRREMVLKGRTDFVG